VPGISWSIFFRLHRSLQRLEAWLQFRNLIQLQIDASYLGICQHRLAPLIYILRGGDLIIGQAKYPECPAFDRV
jgi:hypothetical protein